MAPKKAQTGGLNAELLAQLDKLNISNIKIDKRGAKSVISIAYSRASSKNKDNKVLCSVKVLAKLIKIAGATWPAFMVNLRTQLHELVTEQKTVAGLKNARSKVKQDMFATIVAIRGNMGDDVEDTMKVNSKFDVKVDLISNDPLGAWMNALTQLDKWLTAGGAMVNNKEWKEVACSFAVAELSIRQCKE